MTDGKEAQYNQISFDYNNLEDEKVEEKNNIEKCCRLSEEQINHFRGLLKKLSITMPENCQIPGDVGILELMIMTSKTVAKEGTQFEILIKTKQNNNNKFAFLLDDNVWNVFYCILRNHFSHQFSDSITLINAVKSFKDSREPKSTIDEQLCIDLNRLDTSSSTFADLARQMKEVNDSHLAADQIESDNELESKKNDLNIRDDIFQSIVAKYISVYGEELKDKLKCEPNYKFLLDEDSNYHRYYKNFNTSDN